MAFYLVPTANCQEESSVSAGSTARSSWCSSSTECPPPPSTITTAPPPSYTSSDYVARDLSSPLKAVPTPNDEAQTALPSSAAQPQVATLPGDGPPPPINTSTKPKAAGQSTSTPRAQTPPPESQSPLSRSSQAPVQTPRAPTPRQLDPIGTHSAGSLHSETPLLPLRAENWREWAFNSHISTPVGRVSLPGGDRRCRPVILQSPQPQVATIPTCISEKLPERGQSGQNFAMSTITRPRNGTPIPHPPLPAPYAPGDRPNCEPKLTVVPARRTYKVSTATRATPKSVTANNSYTHSNRACPAVVPRRIKSKPPRGWSLFGL